MPNARNEPNLPPNNHEQVSGLEAALRAALLADAVAVAAPQEHAKLWRYNPPWTLPFARTNELAIELA